jgi:hypothetical protein
MVLATKFLHQGYPDFPVMLKLLELERVNDVTQIAGDHG